MSKSYDRQIGFKRGQEATRRLKIVTDDHLSYLDELRESGETNMFGARPYILSQFPELAEEEAATILWYWMKSFGNPNR